MIVVAVMLVVSALLFCNASVIVEAKISTSLTISAPSSARVNQPFIIAGKLIANGAPFTGKVSLQRLSGRTWVTLASKTVTGTYSFSRTETTATAYRYRTTYAGSASYVSATSPTVTVNIKPTPTAATTVKQATTTPTPTPSAVMPTSNATALEAVTVVQGQNFTIQLQSNPSTGYHWEPQFDSTALSLTDSVFISGPNPHNLVGVPGSQNFTFQGIKQGTSNITFNNISPSNQTANRLTATVTVTAVVPTPTPTPTPTNPPANGYPLAVGTGPAWCTIQGNSQDMWLFANGYDGALWYGVWHPTSTGWGGSWTSLGGQPTSSPAAVSRSEGAVDVYIRGPDGSVMERSYDRTWHDWVNLGGQVAQGTYPAVCSWSADREDLFIVSATDGALLHNTWTTTSGWSGWQSLGASMTLTSSPAAATMGVGLLDVHVRGPDGADYVRSTTNNGATWSNWKSLGGQILAGTSPAVGVWGLNFYPIPPGEGVFITNTNGTMSENIWTTASGWSGWASLGGGGIVSSPAVAMQPHAIEILVRWSNDYLALKEYWSAAWHNWLQTSFLGPPSVTG